jgi:hypothetical protein
MDSRLRGKDVKMTECDWKKDNYKSLLESKISCLALTCLPAGRWKRHPPMDKTKALPVVFANRRYSGQQDKRSIKTLLACFQKF